MTTITINGNTYNVVTLPTFPAPKAVDFDFNDTVAQMQSPYTKQTPQIQSWPGADWITGQVSLPQMTRRQAAPWIAFLAELRGIANCFQIGDYQAQHPLGSAQGAPLVDGSVGTNNQAGATTLFTKGWMPSRFRLLLPGDYLQLGYRLHMVVDSPVNSDSSGNAEIQIYPSIREQPTDGLPIILNNPRGLFRLVVNKRGYQTVPALTSLKSFDITEAR